MHHLLILLLLICITTKKSYDGLKEVLVTHQDQNNKNNPIEVKLLSGAELKKQLDEAKADLETALKTLGHPETGAITKSQAEVVTEPRRSAIAHENDLGHDVIDGTKVIVEGEEVVIYGEVEGKWTRLISKPVFLGMDHVQEGEKKETESGEGALKDIKRPFSMNGESHTLFFTGSSGNVEMASRRDFLSNKIGRRISYLKAKEKTEPDGSESRSRLLLQVDDLMKIGVAAKELQTLAKSGSKDPSSELNQVNRDKFNALLTLIMSYASNFGVGDIEAELADASQFDRHLYNALKIVAKSQEIGVTTQDSKDLRGQKSTVGTGGKDAEVKAEQERLAKEAQDKKDAIDRNADLIHKEILKSRADYLAASRAEFYGPNTFMVGSGSFFVSVNNNLYIIPNNDVTRAEYFYNIAKKGGGWRNLTTLVAFMRNEFSTGLPALEAKVVEKQKLGGSIPAAAKTKLIQDAQNKVALAKAEQAALATDNKEEQLLWIKRSTYVHTELNGLLKDVRAEIGVEKTYTAQFAYHKFDVNTQEGKDLIKEWPYSVKDNSPRSTVKVAAILAEPSRYSVAHISNMLLLDKDAKSPKEIGKKDALFGHTSMTQSGSDESKTAAELAKTDPAKAKPDPKLDAAATKMVTERDLASVRAFNPGLATSLVKIHNAMSKSPADEIVTSFAAEITKYMKRND